MAHGVNPLAPEARLFVAFTIQPVFAARVRDQTRAAHSKAFGEAYQLR